MLPPGEVRTAGGLGGTHLCHARRLPERRSVAEASGSYAGGEATEYAGWLVRWYQLPTCLFWQRWELGYGRFRHTQSAIPESRLPAATDRQILTRLLCGVADLRASSGERMPAQLWASADATPVVTEAELARLLVLTDTVPAHAQGWLERRSGASLRGAILYWPHEVAQLLEDEADHLVAAADAASRLRCIRTGAANYWGAFAEWIREWAPRVRALPPGDVDAAMDLIERIRSWEFLALRQRSPFEGGHHLHLEAVRTLVRDYLTPFPLRYSADGEGHSDAERHLMRRLRSGAPDVREVVRYEALLGSSHTGARSPDHA